MTLDATLSEALSNATDDQLDTLTSVLDSLLSGIADRYSASDVLRLLDSIVQDVEISRT